MYVVVEVYKYSWKQKGRSNQETKTVQLFETNAENGTKIQLKGT